MKLFPTISIKNGKCYNMLPKQEFQLTKSYSGNPVKIAKMWESIGAKQLHVVDMDGARLGTMANEEILKSILDAVDIPVQFGGGVRSIKDIDHCLDLGVWRVACGTRPVQDLRFVREAVSLFTTERLAISIDIANGMIAVEGREKMLQMNTVSFLQKLRDAGAKTVLYTDIVQSGLRKGPDLEDIRELKARTDLNLIVAGGIRDISDLDHLQKIGVHGAIIAAALYDGCINFEDAVKQFER